MLRTEITQAVDQAPANIRTELTGPGLAALELLNAHLPADEEVRHLISASPSKGEPNSVLALTNRRLVFVAPSPQAVSWRLARLTRSQAFAGLFIVNGDAGEYSLYVPGSEWATYFENQVKTAAAIAVIAGN